MKALPPGQPQPEKTPKQVLKAKLEHLQDQLAQGKFLSEQDVEQLKYLSTVVDLQYKYRPLWQNPKLYLFLIVLVAYGGIAWSLTRTQAKTAIQLEAVTSGLSFTMSNDSALTTGDLDITSLRFDNIVYDWPDYLLSGASPRTSKNLELRAIDDTSGLSLEPIELKPQMRVSIEGDSSGLTIKVKPDSFRATITGKVSVAGMKKEEIEETEPSDRFILDMQTLEDSSIQLGLNNISTNVDENTTYELSDFNLGIDTLIFQDVNSSATSAKAKVSSDIQQGSLYIESSDSLYTLRSGENLSLGTIEEGSITSLQATPEGHIKLQFIGIVDDIKTGHPEWPVSQMPTYLDWLRARRLATPLLGGLLTILPLFITMVSFLGDRR